MNDDLKEAKKVLEIEAESILRLREHLDGLPKAVDLLFACKGKVIVTGMGKSGAIGRKIAATFNSTGTPAVFLHPAESAHGDLGVIGSNDVVLALSYGGESVELNHLLDYVARKGIGLIACTGHLESALAQAADVVIDVSIEKEACPMGLAPTASSTATLAMGDALAVVLLKRKGFSEKEFAEYHPGGQLGRRLLTRVRDVMHSGAELPLVGKDIELRQVLMEMTDREVCGVAGVIEENGDLAGVITDGDVRRLLERSLNPLDQIAESVMSKNPKTVDAGELAEKSLFVMEQFAISMLFVVDRTTERPRRPVGIIHLQDLLKAKVR